MWIDVYNNVVLWLSNEDCRDELFSSICEWLLECEIESEIVEWYWYEDFKVIWVWLAYWNSFREDGIEIELPQNLEDEKKKIITELKRLTLDFEEKDIKLWAISRISA